jgi:parallel beta-helix repeat protein
MILNCEIFESPTGISGQYSDSCLLLYNHIHHNATGISLRQSTYLRIDSNEVSENTGMGIRTSGRLDLSGNEIHHNGGGLLLASSGNLSNDSARLVGNRIHHNSTAGGLQMETGDQPVYLGGNLIYNNTNLQMHGGGLSLWQSTGPSSCIIENNTIANNDVLRFLSGYNFFLNSQTNGLLNIRLTNNIFWSSRFQPLNMVLPPSSALDFRNNCINQDSSLVWSNSNLNAYPEFVNPTLTAGASDTTANPDWALNWNSPCINAGNSFTSDNLPPFDLLGNARIFDGQVDIGALEYPRWTGLLDPDLGDPVLLYPNPARSYIRVRSPAPGIIEFNINDIVGKVQLFGKIRDTEIIDISKLLPGAYNLSLRTSEGTLFQTRFIRY